MVLKVGPKIAQHGGVGRQARSTSSPSSSSWTPSALALKRHAAFLARGLVSTSDLLREADKGKHTFVL
jgi:hypothetical protein